MDPMDEIRETFFLECEELLEALDGDLSAMAHGGADSEQVNSVFRAVHSIKGGAAAFGFDDLVRFSHTFETTLDEVRNDRLETTREVMDVFLRARDILADLVSAAQSGSPAPDNADSVRNEIIALTEENASGGETAGDDGEAAADDTAGDDEYGFEPMSLDFGDIDEGPAQTVYTIRFAPKPELFAHGNEAIRLISALSEMGEMTTETDESLVPAFDELNPDDAYLSYTLTLTSEVDEEAIREVFEFVDDECELEITSEEVAAEAGDGEDAPSTDDDDDGFAPLSIEIDEDLAADLAETKRALAEPTAEAPKEPEKSEDAPAPGPIPSTAAAPKKAAPAPTPKTTVRVDLDRVDRLINMVGELVINQAMLAQTVTECGVATDTAVAAGLEDFRRLTRELQDNVMAIRAQPVKSLFQRMSRIVREAAGMTSKRVRLELVGESTEVDKTLVERLSEPLTHMIRNAVDHGLEDADARIAAGKEAEGTVTLSAAHRSGRVLIEVSDDGAGVNREKVFAKAVERGLIAADAQLTDSEIDNLLFMPGFSTADQVSDLSGRGVGMDVVRKAIQALGGRINISSTPGKGTSFKISLPLTLAVLDGMLVKVAGQTLVVPVTVITETLKPSREAVQTVHGGTTVLRVRDRFVPVFDVGEAFGYREALQGVEDIVVLLIETVAMGPAALVVDNIIDQRQVVIKGLEKNYGAIPGIAAATILGDGQIALIMDAEAVVTKSKDQAPLAATLPASGESEHVVN